VVEDVKTVKLQKHLRTPRHRRLLSQCFGNEVHVACSIDRNQYPKHPSFVQNKENSCRFLVKQVLKTDNDMQRLDPTTSSPKVFAPPKKPTCGGDLIHVAVEPLALTAKDSKSEEKRNASDRGGGWESRGGWPRDGDRIEQRVRPRKALLHENLQRA
jgi:hypothetical protein